MVADLFFPVPQTPGVQLLARTADGGLDAVVGAGGEVVVAGFQELGDVGKPVLGPDRDASFPVGGGAVVGVGVVMGGGAGE